MTKKMLTKNDEQNKMKTVDNESTTVVTCSMTWQSVLTETHMTLISQTIR